MFEPLHKRIEEYNDIDIRNLNSKQLQSLKVYHIDQLLRNYSQLYEGKISMEILNNLSMTLNLVVKHKRIICDKYYKKFIEDNLKECIRRNYKIDYVIVPQPEHKTLYFQYPHFNWNHHATLIKYPEWFV